MKKDLKKLPMLLIGCIAIAFVMHLLSAPGWASFFVGSVWGVFVAQVE